MLACRSNGTQSSGVLFFSASCQGPVDMSPANFSCPGVMSSMYSSPLLSPCTGLGWLPYRSKMVGATSFCYALAFLWGGWPVFLAQAIFSFMSDFVFTGRDSHWHPADRLLATSNVFFIVPLWLLSEFPWSEAVATAITFTGYFVAVRFGIKRRRADIYAIGHTAWHLFGGISIASFTRRVCDFSWAPSCQPRRFHYLYCSCARGDSASRWAFASSSSPNIFVALALLGLAYVAFEAMRAPSLPVAAGRASVLGTRSTSANMKRKGSTGVVVGAPQQKMRQMRLRSSSRGRGPEPRARQSGQCAPHAGVWS